MTRRFHRPIAALVGLVALATALVAPSAGALSIHAAIPPADSGTTATAVFAGGLDTCALLKGGQLKCWGYNGQGKLGLGDLLNNRGDAANEMGDFLPTIDLGTGRKAKTVAFGWQHTCAILDNGKVKCWGYNYRGQLGYGDTTSRGDGPNEMGNALPYVPLGAGRRAKALALGTDFSCALLDNGTVKCWGRNHQGQLGIGNITDANTNIGDQAGEMAALIPVPLGRKAKAITAGDRHVCALLDNGTVKCWGGNDDGQAGIGTNVDPNAKIGDEPGEIASLNPINLGAGRKVKVIAAGNSHTCALLDNNTVRCWGANGDGQLGLGNNFDLGDDELITSQPTVDLGTSRKVKNLVVGGLGYHNCAVFDDRSIKCWGYNDGSGTLGLGDMENHGDGPNEMGTHLPFLSVGGGRTVKSIVGGSDHTCALLDNNTVKCWGWNLQGQLGYGDKEHRGDNESIDGVPSVNLGVRVRTFSSYQWHSCAILENRSVECWGWNGEGYGQRGGLGLGDFLNRGDNPDEMGNNLPAVNLGTGRTAKALSVGPAYAHTCAILDNNTLKCWGWNGAGQLGLGDDVNRGDTADAGREMGDLLATVNLGAGRTARAVASGEAHTCALLDNGTVKCWGYNGYGQLGNGDNTGDKINIGDQAGEMAALLPLPLGRKAKAVAAGGNFSCALLDNGTVKCWGNNEFGQLGQGDTANRGDGPGEVAALQPVALGRKAKAITAGLTHVCVLLDNNTVKCWGHNNDTSSGALGLGDTDNRGDGPDEMGADLLAVDLGSGRTARSVVAGDTHTCAVLDNYTVKCWGWNDFGRLGLGNTAHRGDEVDEMGDYLPAVAVGGSRRVVAVSLGEFSCALLDDASIRCWGYNSEGQLARGDTDNRGDEPGEMGNNLVPVAFTG